MPNINLNIETFFNGDYMLPQSREVYLPGVTASDYWRIRDFGDAKNLFVVRGDGSVFSNGLADSNSTIYGESAGSANSVIQSAFGLQAGAGNTGNNQSVFGYYAGYQNSGDNQSAMGHLAGYQNTGNNQTAIGWQAGAGNTNNAQSVVGYRAGINNSGDAQTAMGQQAGNNNTGRHQSAFGYQAGNNNTGRYQSAFGYQAGYQNSGWYQSAFGYNAGKSNIGFYNSNFGYQAGYYLNDGVTVNTTSIQSLYLGSNTRSSALTTVNENVLGYAALGNGSNTFTFGNSSITHNYFSGAVQTRIQGTTVGHYGVRIRDFADIEDVFSVTGDGITKAKSLETVDNANLQGAIYKTIRNISTTQNVQTKDYTLNVTSGTITITLPDAITEEGRVIFIKNSGAGIVTVDTLSSQTIDGNLTIPLNAGDNISVQSNGTNWIILNTSI